jgi:predicted porin
LNMQPPKSLRRSMSSRAALGLALALELAAAGSAQAQSTVTTYGVVDVYAGRWQLASRAKANVVNSGGLTTSRIGFTGSEDLGSGMKANFNITALMRTDLGSMGRFDGDPFWSSRSTVGLSGSFGEANAGRMNSPLFFALIKFDAFGLAAIGPLFLQTFPGGQPITAPQQVSDSAINNSIQYATPTISGFRAALHHGFGEVAGSSNKGRTGASLTWDSGPLSLGVAGDNITNPLPAGETKQTAVMAAASYDFKVVKVSGVWQRHEQKTLGNDYRISTLGASMPVGQATITASWSHLALDRAVGIDLARNTGAVAYDYYLSKRTDLYAMLVLDRMTDKDSGKSLVTGIRHRF